MFDYLYQESLSHAVHKVWILSDLQQALPENTRRCLASGISDFERLERPAEQIWYLGDAVEGAEPERLIAMCRLQEDAFASLGLPLCYATGNHDYDYSRAHKEQPSWMPFYEMVRDHPGWKTTARCEDFYFRTETWAFFSAIMILTVLPRPISPHGKTVPKAGMTNAPGNNPVYNPIGSVLQYKQGS